MRRLSVLLGLIMLVWLASESDPLPANASVATLTPQQQSCCQQGTGDNPHLECVSNQCVQVNTCGFDTCDGCLGCDPYGYLEWQCIALGWYWDPIACACTPPSCDPYGTGAAYCYAVGGIWDPFTCVCTPAPCNPGPPVIEVSPISADIAYCVYNYWVYCRVTYFIYTQYCQNGFVYSQWTEDGTYCRGSFDFCDLEGGG